ncbi:hypothetical protein VRK_07430 [Vibrio sp. MEBiC08052]|nr:hypothetical protein VRK_07430 [Vibrio sp. MEBiC08052]
MRAFYVGSVSLGTRSMPFNDAGSMFGLMMFRCQILLRHAIP